MISDEEKRGLASIHLILVGGLMIIQIFFAFYLTETDSKSLSFDLNWSLLAGIGFSAIGIVYSRLLYNKDIETIEGRDLDVETFPVLRSANLKMWALLEATALINLIFYYSHGNTLFLYMSVGLLFMLYISRPNFRL